VHVRETDHANAVGLCHQVILSFPTSALA